MYSQAPALPDVNTMYNALVSKDSTFEGVFFAAVKTTGIFCRPTCTARKPKQQNTEFFATAKEALQYGYRPCKVCQPLRQPGEYPDWIKQLVDELGTNPRRIKAWDLKQRGLEPATVNRWFKKHLDMTFVAYQKSLRISRAFGTIKLGEKVTAAAFDAGYESLSGFAETFKNKTGFSPANSKNRAMIVTTRIPTPLGPMLACATDEGICLLEFTDRPMLETQLARIEKILKAKPIAGNSPYFELLAKELDAYFAGSLQNFTVPLVMGGSEFQKKVWTILLDIPYGHTSSYMKQSERLGNTKAIRAVAGANGDNRISIVIPCHRVIGSDGSLTGYGGGLWRKKWLLDHEAKVSGNPGSLF